MTKTLPQAKDFNYPVDLSPYIPGATQDDTDSHSILREEADNVRDEWPRTQYPQADKIAASNLVRWYQEAPENEAMIREHGILWFISTYGRPKVWATLRYFKDNGTTFPL